MSETSTGRSEIARNEVFDALARQRRRCVLRVLDRVSRCRPEELATHVVAEELDKPTMDVTRREAADVLATLEHVHLPKLVDAGLLQRDGGAITTTQHPAFQDPTIDAIVRTEAPGLDEVLHNLGDLRRRVVLTSLYGNDGPMDRTDLAAEVAETVRGGSGQEVTVDSMRRDLHHVHLPKLARAGLISYDADEGSVTYEGHPAFEEEWLLAESRDTPRAIPSTAD